MVAKQMHAAYAGWVAPTRVSRNVLMLAAAASLGLWALAETWVRSEASVPIRQMHAAAASMVSAQAAIRLAKERRGLLQPPDIDPNRTGLIGPEWSEITTTLGILPAKRTATNPDFAAALVRLIDRLGLTRGTPVVLVLSGSLVGANVASIIAVETLGLEPLVVSSLGASMYGATDLAFSWLDIEAEMRAANIIKARTLVAVIGGERAVGRGMDPAGRAALTASAARHDIPIAEAQPLSALVAQV
jgi:poly-gamma-glutamate system protein